MPQLYSGMAEAEIMRVADVTEAALPVVTHAVREAVALRGRAILVLAGGHTPLPLYRRLATADLPWDRVHVFWGDERFVDLTDPNSNAGAAMSAFLDRVGVPESQIHVWPILHTPEASAAAYHGELEQTLGRHPVFDVTLLGLGDDAHTASLFPETGDVLREGLTFATEAPPAAAVRDRLTLGAPALSCSRLVIFLVTGQDKLPALRATFRPEAPTLAQGRPLPAETARELDAHPARAVTALERLLLITDQDF